MPLATNFLSRNQSLYALDDNDNIRAYTEITTQMSGWSCSAGVFELSQEYREYPMYYSFKIQDSNPNSTITLSINNVTIDGVNTTNLNSFKLVGHALFRADAAARVNTTLGVRSSFDLNNVAKLYSASSQTSLTASILTPVRSGHIDVRKNSTAVLTSVYGNGTYIKYDCANSFKRGDLVYIFDTTQESFNATTTPVAVQYACNSFFTVQSSITGYVLPTSGYVKLSDPPEHLISYPYPDYAGEDMVSSLSFLISQHAGEPIYVTIPAIVDMNRIFASWSTQLGTQTLPQVLIDIDQTSTTEWPILRLLHSLTSNVEDVVDKYVAIERTDANLRPAYIDTDANINKSYLVDPGVALSEYYDWLIQFVGQTQSFASMSSNKAADYGATVKVRCATTTNITISSALNGGDSLDGVTLAADDRVLVKNQTIASENGIYIVGLSPARWSGMPASSVSIASLSPATPLLGYSQITTSAAHGFSAGDTVVITGVTPSGHNGEYVIYSVPTTTTFVVESTEVATATLSSATAKRAVDTTNPDLIFVREGTVNKMTMWSPASQGWTGTANESASVTNSRTTSPRTNLCTNPSFESNTTGWGAYLVTNTRTAGTIAGGVGSWSLVSTATATGVGGCFFDNLVGVAGSSLTSSVNVLRLSGNRSYQIRYEFYNGAVNIGTSLGTANACATSTRLTLTATIPATTTRTVVAIYSSGTGAIGDAIQTDALLMEYSSTVGDYFDGSTNPNSRWTGTAHASTSIISGRGNLINNPSFETATTGWNAANVSLARITTDAYIGSASLQITSTDGTDTTARTGQTTNWTAIAGLTYSGSVYLKNTVGNNRQHLISLKWYNASGGTISETVGTPVTLTVGGDWQRFTITGTAPAGTVSADLFIYPQYNNPSTSNITLADACMVEQSSTVGDYFDGYNDDNSPWAITGEDFINFSVKQLAAKVATTGNITISTALNNLDTIDGISLATGDYVLVKNQTTASENGIYQVAATPVRITNMAAGIPLSTGFRAYVWGSGTANTETMFTLDDGGLIGTDTLNFTASVKPFAWDDADEFKLWQLSNKYFGYKAGSLEAIEETVRRYLIGNQEIRIALNPPFECIIYTLRDETLGIYYTSDFITTSEIINNAISITRPLGFKITHEAVATFNTFIIGTGIIGTDRLG